MVNCSCKLDSIIDHRRDPKDIFEHKFEILRNGNNIKLMVGYLEQEFENYRTVYKDTEDEIFYAYIFFLSMYTGKIIKADLMLQEKM